LKYEIESHQVSHPCLTWALMFFQKGYEGMLTGGDCIKELSWQAVSGIIEKVQFFIHLSAS
jgi:6-phosphofructokinase